MRSICTLQYTVRLLLLYRSRNSHVHSDSGSPYGQVFEQASEEQRDEMVRAAAVSVRTFSFLLEAHQSGE